MSAPYRGWHSTKLHLALITMATITIVYAFMGFPTVLFGEFCMTLTAASGIFSGASVMAGKQVPKAQEIDAP